MWQIETIWDEDVESVHKTERTKHKDPPNRLWIGRAKDQSNSHSSHALQHKSTLPFTRQRKHHFISSHSGSTFIFTTIAVSTHSIKIARKPLVEADVPLDSAPTINVCQGLLLSMSLLPECSTHPNCITPDGRGFLSSTFHHKSKGTKMDDTVIYMQVCGPQHS